MARTNRLNTLTGLRIFAAFAVYLSHVAALYRAPPALRNFMESGYMGVTLFFTLSGVVLTISYFDDLRRVNLSGMWRYAVARLARIYPLYLVTLAPVVTAKALQGHSIHGWLDHVLALQAWSPSLREAYAFDGPAWSIWVEVVLYACFPLLALALARVCSMRALAITGIVTLAAMLGLVIWFVATHRSGLPWESSASAHRWLYRTPITRLGDFLIGMLIARAYFKARDRPYAARMGEALSITGALAILLLMIWPRFLSRRGAGIWGM